MCVYVCVHMDVCVCVCVCACVCVHVGVGVCLFRGTNIDFNVRSTCQ